MAPLLCSKIYIAAPLPLRLLPCRCGGTGEVVLARVLPTTCGRQRTNDGRFCHLLSLTCTCMGRLFVGHWFQEPPRASIRARRARRRVNGRETTESCAFQSNIFFSDPFLLSPCWPQFSDPIRSVFLHAHSNAKRFFPNCSGFASFTTLIPKCIPCHGIICPPIKLIPLAHVTLAGDPAGGKTRIPLAPIQNFFMRRARGWFQEPPRVLPVPPAGAEATLADGPTGGEEPESCSLHSKKFCADRSTHRFF